VSALINLSITKLVTPLGNNPLDLFSWSCFLALFYLSESLPDTV
jgi:hypothetical protein